MPSINRSERKPIFHLEKENDRVHSNRTTFSCLQANLLLQFEKAAQAPVESAFWTKNRELSKCVIETSLDMPCLSLAVEERASELLNVSRRLVKYATTTDDSVSAGQSLLVAVHVIRALVGVTGSRNDSLIKLLYHCMTTAERLPNTFDYAWNAFEGLKVLLDGYVTENVGCKLHDNLFPLPNLQKKSSSVRITTEQLFTISIDCMVSMIQLLVGRDASTQDSVNLLRIQLAMDLVNQITLQWLSFQLNYVGYNKKTVQNNCKRIHRILWKAATTEETSFDLRQLAIGTLLLISSNETPSEAVFEIRIAHFGDACHYAGIAVSSYLKTPNAMEKIKLFHAMIGTILDETASRIPTLTASYFLYCACRALHLGSISIPTHVRGQESISTTDHSFDEAAVGVFYLSLNLREQLEKGESHITRGYERVISRFSNLITVESKSIASYQRWLNLLSKIELNKAIFISLTQQQFQHDTLRCCGRILSECLGPLTISLIKYCSNDESKLSNYWNSAVEYFQRACAAFDAVGDFCQVNKVASTLSDILRSTDSSPPCDCLVKGAKFIASIGRSRWDSFQSVDSITLILHSLLIFTHLSESQIRSRTNELQLSVRWSFLSSLYSQLDHNDEAILSMAIAIAFDAIEQMDVISLGEEQLLMDLIALMAKLSRGSIKFGPRESFLFTARRQGYVTTLIRLLRTSRGKSPNHGVPTQHDVQPLSLLAIAGMLKYGDNHTLSSLFEKETGLQFSLDGIFQSLFNAILRPCEKVGDGFSDGVKFLSAMCLAIHRLGEVLTSESEATIDIALQHAAIVDVVRLSIKNNIQLSNLNGGEVILLKILGIFSAASITPKAQVLHMPSCLVGRASISDTDCQYLLRRRAVHYLTSVLMLEASEKFLARGEWSLLLKSVQIAAFAFLMQLQNTDIHCDYGAAIEVNKLILDYTYSMSKNSQCDIVIASKYCISHAAIELRDFLDAQGDAVDATYTSLLSLSISCSQMNEMILSNIQSNAYLCSVDPTLLCIGPVFPERKYYIERLPFDLEISAAAARLDVFLQDEKRSSNDIEGALRDLMRRIDSLSSLDIEYRAVGPWIESTVLLGLADCAALRGDWDEAARCVKESFNRVQGFHSTLQAKISKKERAEEISSPWEFGSEVTMACKLSTRQLECVYRLALLYDKLGDYRKCMSYAIKLLFEANPDLQGTLYKTRNFSEVLNTFQSMPCSSLRDLRCKWLFVKLKARSIPLNTIYVAIDDAEAFTETIGESLSSQRHTTFSTEIMSFQKYFLVWDIIGAERTLMTTEVVESMLETTKTSIQTWQGVKASLPFSGDIEFCGTAKEALAIQLRLQNLSFLMQKNVDACSVSEEDLNMLCLASKCTNFPNELRVQAHYLMSQILMTCNQQEARRCLTSALKLVGSSCDYYAQDVLRTLAEISANEGNPKMVCKLVNASIGRSSNRKIVQSLSESRFPIHLEIMQAFDRVDSILDDRGPSEMLLAELASQLPHKWRIVSLALCPSGKLIATSISVSSDGSLSYRGECVCSYDSCCSHPSRAYGQMMKPLDDILLSMHSGLKSGHEESISDDNAAKRKWWAGRRALDLDLKKLLANIEAKFFDSQQMNSLIFGDMPSSVPCCRLTGNLASRFEEAAVNEFELIRQRPKADVNLMTVKELRRELAESDLLVPRNVHKMKKSELVEKVRELREFNHREAPNDTSDTTGTDLMCASPADGEECIFLILDENLHRFPFESMECFEGRSLYRVPSLQFLCMMLDKYVNSRIGAEAWHEINPMKTSFVIDPESDLLGSQHRLVPLITSLSHNVGRDNWKGVVGVEPGPDFIKNQLIEESGTLLYFGHGGGEKFLSRSALNELLKNRNAKSAVILMGCSSGKLESVNRKGSNYVGELPLYYEPEGVALSYLMSGVPCVVGNLWDVTDVDIDRFSIEMLEKWYNGDFPIGTCVSNARNVCKLRYLVGAAPVCYGIPVAIGKRDIAVNGK